MSTTTAEVKSFKFIDPNGNILILTPVDQVARQAIEDAKDLQFNEDDLEVEETEDEVQIRNKVTPISVTPNTPLEIDQNDANGFILGSRGLYSISACASVYNSTSGTYAVGKIVTHLGKLYRCTTAVSQAEAFDPSKWTEVHLVNLIQDISSNVVTKSDLDNLITNTFSSSETYEVGDYCIYNKALYKCKVAVTTAGDWTGATNWDAVHDLIAEAKAIKVTSNTASDDSVSSTVHTSILHLNTYKEITVADTTTKLVIQLDSAIVGFLQQTGFQFTLGANSVLSGVEVISGDWKLPICTNYESFSPGQTYQGNVTASGVTIAEFDPKSRLSINVGGRDYPYVRIGDQLWIIENLDYVWSGLTLTTPSATSEQRAAYPNNQESNRTKFGLLYNWYAASYLHSNKSTLLPDGWDVAGTSAWDKLIEFAGGSSVAGGKLRSREYSGTDNYGFNALLTGYIYFSYGAGSPNYMPPGTWGQFYTPETGVQSQYGYSYAVSTNNNQANKYNGTYKVNYESIRLVKSLT